MKNYFLMYLLLAVIFFSCKKKEFKIEVFSAMNENSKHKPPTKAFYFLLEGFNHSEHQIDSITNFVCSSLDSSFYKYHTFWFSFYKKTSITNNENIRKNPKDFFRYSTDCDHLLSYRFTKNGSRTMRIYKNSMYSIKRVNFECEGFK